ncbi:SAM domain (Sterile alpha motif) [Carpediemonas membranifera]|uniref:SAM domain (Sterile alpha motif) n=1 Tax=Carpediemonas membranifera TaxID=201153 RepID=A0A8J6BC62_9EUKA|nr:SAM domain (Sterile alpha motif) [Carpediemonas membranifera]|eukprot:KAG9394317.1 SAM domain (Sterile alpha motif) [Carpediemonas membranifera]
MSTPRIKLINPIEEWSEGDVCSWLNGIKMRHHAEVFRKNGINGRALLRLTEEDLLNSLNVTKLGERRSIRYEIDNLENWMGWLWREEVNGTTIEALLTLSANKMIALTCVRLEPVHEPVQGTWTFTKLNDTGDVTQVVKFTTDVNYEGEKSRNIIRLPCPVSDVEATFQAAEPQE